MTGDPARIGIRVCHVLTNLNLGGAQTSVSLVTRGLFEAGLDVQVVCSTLGGRKSLVHPFLPCMIRDEGIPLHDVPAMRRPVKPLLDAKACCDLERLFRQLQPDLVHTHMSKAGILGRLAARRAGVPVVVHSARGWAFSSDSPRLMKILYIWFERILAGRTDAILAVSRRTMEEGLSVGIGRKGQYHVIRTGIDVDRFRFIRRSCDNSLLIELGIPSGSRIVGTVMGISPKKAPMEFIEVCRIIHETDPDVHFVVVGDGELRCEFEKRIIREGLENWLHVTGLREDVTPYLASFDVFLLTSHWEGLPRVILEAVAAGIPIVATDAGGTSELKGWTDSLFISEPGAVGELARGVLRCLRAENQQEREGPGLPKEFHLQTVVEEHINLYRSLLQDRNPVV